MQARPPVLVGVDIGQLHDPTALCVAECIAQATGQYREVKRVPAHIDKRGRFVPALDAEEVYRTHYYIRHIRRLPIGTSYPEVSRIIGEVLANPLFAGRFVGCAMDVTGVGRPVYDELCLVEARLRREARHVQVVPITFAHGDTYNTATGRLGKAFLVSRLQALLQGQRIHAPDTPEVRATVDELKVYEIKVTQDGKDTYGAEVGAHDDLATALGLACLHDPIGLAARHSERMF
jgi:hypothetical protein